ncbi:hypothetical protein U9M48_034501 [Paspalum notatum var. saurae]|uniref:Reverse transcriptase Ty1/copia-type domain-containing protein n=1 Tax=Paspalum notatum var. saurae TaxID=547442 RepID=A0AAQ3X8Z3_PASNO
MLASSVPPHFWAEAVSTATYLINIQPSSALRGGIPLERLSGKAPDYSDLRLFGCVCYVLLAPRERTKLTAQSVECVFLGYSAEHKGYRCWDPVGRRIRISRDVVFDESRPFYPRPSSDASLASLVDPLSFLFIPDTAIAHRPSLLIPSSTVFTHAVRSTPPEPTSDEPSPTASSPEQLLRRGHRSRQPVDRYGFGPVTWQGFAGTVLSEPLSYRDDILHPEWQLAMAEEIAALERTGTWDIVPTPSHVRPITCSSGLVSALCFVVTNCRFFADPHDPALFVHTSSRGHTLLLLYVDDMIITGDDPQFIAFVKARLSEQFLMSDLVPLRYFLGIEVSSAPEGFYLSQEKYIQGLLDRASLTDHKTEETPMELNLHLSATDGEPLDDPTRYRHIVDFGVSVSIPTPLLTDSTGAISIARDPVKHELTKHIGVDAYYTRAQCLIMNTSAIHNTKLQNLARQRLWCQCVKCKHMIELAEDCYHMVCVCGYEFCYTCGKEWKEKKATCSCPLWDERNIIRDEDDDEEDGLL